MSVGRLEKKNQKNIQFINWLSSQGDISFIVNQSMETIQQIIHRRLRGD